MATYREIHGKTIKSVSTDPSATTDAGQVWYNTTSDTFKSIVNTSAWTSCGPLISVQGDMANVGTQTASLCAGGSNNPGSENVDVTQEGNGTGFSLGGSLNTERRGCAGFGSQTSAVCFGGYTTTYDNNTEEYNGTAWTNGNDTPLSPGTASWNSGGTLTAGLGYGGSDLGPGATPPVNRGKQTIEYDGTNWADGNQMTRTSGDGMTGFGIQTAALAAGQSTPPGSPSATTVVENYDGTNWTSGTVTPTGVAYCGSGGTQTAGLIFGGVSNGSPGYPTKVTTTLSWNGTSWSSEPALATARMGTWGGPVGSSTSSQLMGGNSGPGVVSNVENFDSSINVVTAAAWSSGANFPTNSSAVAGVGPRDAALGIGGYPAGSPPTGKSFEYNGVAWSAEATLNPNTGTGGVSSAAGTQTAVICTQLPSGGGAPYNAAGEYDGSSWSNAEDRPASNYSDGSAGTQTAGLFFGGAASPSSFTNATISYDGTDWTVEESMSVTKTVLGGCGTSTAALACGGITSPPATLTDATEIYGGESWTAGGTLLTTLRDHRASGPSTDAIVAGGRIGGAPPTVFLTACTRYDGTAWSTAPNLGTARGLQGAGNGPVGAAWGAAGYYPGSTPNRTNTTEHFNVETTAINVKTLTTS